MHLSFESLAVINAPGLQASLMDIHHDTSFRSTLEDDSISLTFRAHVCFWGHGYGWLLSHLFVHFALHILPRLQHCVFILV
jgi:hypothetical protein